MNNYYNLAQAKAQELAKEPALVPLKNTMLYNPTCYEHLCWIFVNKTLRKDTLKKFGFTRQSFFDTLIESRPNCAVCKKPLKWNGNTYHYLDEITCSKNCCKKTKTGNERYNKSIKLSVEKRKKTNQLNGDNAWSSEVRKKREQTKIEKYGHKTGFSEITETKRKQTLLTRYGVSNSFSTPEGLEAIKQQKVKEKLGSLNTMLSLNSNFSNVLWDGHWLPSEWHCNRCHTEFYVETTNPSCAIRCPECDPVVGSLIQKKLFDKLREILPPDIEIMYNTRKTLYPRELDIFIPAFNVAIEVNGIYWHSYNRVVDKNEKNKASNKWKSCLEKNISLLTFFEDELYDLTLPLSMILAKCGLFKKRIGARKLKIKEISFTDAKIFLEKNHIRTSAVAKLCIGLFENDKLLQVATFGKSRFEKDRIELIRFATEQHYQVIGGFSKLLNYAKNILNSKNIISYADCCYSTGATYRQLSNEEKYISPGYFWWKPNTPFKQSRFKFQKHKLKKNALINFSAAKTEAEMMFEAGYRQLWDCGSIKFIL